MRGDFMSLPKEIREMILRKALSVENNIHDKLDQEYADEETRQWRISRLVFYKSLHEFQTSGEELEARKQRKIKTRLIREQPELQYHEDWRILPFDDLAFFDSEHDFIDYELKLIVREAYATGAQEMVSVHRIYHQGGVVCQEWSELLVDSFIAFDDRWELLWYDIKLFKHRLRRERAVDPRPNIWDDEEVFEDLEEESEEESEDPWEEELEEYHLNLYHEPAQTWKLGHILLPLLVANRQISTEALEAFYKENTLVMLNFNTFISSPADDRLLNFIQSIIPTMRESEAPNPVPEVALVIDLYQYPEGPTAPMPDDPIHGKCSILIESRYLPTLVDGINTYPHNFDYIDIVANTAFVDSRLLYGYAPVYFISLKFNTHSAYSEEYMRKRTSQLIDGLKGIRCITHMVSYDGEEWTQGKVSWNRLITIDGLDDRQQAKFMKSYNLHPPEVEEEEIDRLPIDFETELIRHFPVFYGHA